MLSSLFLPVRVLLRTLYASFWTKIIIAYKCTRTSVTIMYVQRFVSSKKEHLFVNGGKNGKGEDKQASKEHLRLYLHVHQRPWVSPRTP